VLEHSVLDLIPADRKVSIEREVWPALVGKGLYGFDDQDAYWVDIGTPERYLQATFDILEGKLRSAVADKLGDSFLAVDPSVHNDGRVIPPAVIGAGTRIEAGAAVGSLVAIGEDVVVGEGAIVERCVVLDGAQIGAGCVLRDCIVGPRVSVGERTQVVEGAMLGEGVTLGADNVLARGARVFPGVEVPDGAIAF